MGRPRRARHGVTLTRSTMRTGIRRPTMLWVLGLLMVGALRTFGGAGDHAPATEAALFDPSAVWNVHFRFTADAWSGLEPKGGSGNWGTIMAASQKNASRSNTPWSLPPVMMKRGDANHDGR